MGFAIFALLMTSCSSINQTMREPTSGVKFVRNDFSLSKQVTGEARTVKVLCIDWARLFSKKTGDITDKSSGITAANIPVIGSLSADGTQNYALYNLMTQNPGYDVVFYPQYRTKVLRPFLGLGFIVNITTVNATARLGKLKGDYDNAPAPRQTVRNRFDQTQPQVRENDNSYSKDTNTSNVTNASANNREENANATYDLNQPAKPVGGERAYNNYIERNRNPLTKYDKCSVSHGKVILLFNVDKQGRPENISVFKSLCSAADSEAIRLLQNGPDWTTSNAETRLEINF